MHPYDQEISRLFTRALSSIPKGIENLSAQPPKGVSESPEHANLVQVGADDTTPAERHASNALGLLVPAPLVGPPDLLRVIVAMAQHYWRPLGLGLLVGCTIALLIVGVGSSLPQLQLSHPGAAPSRGPHSPMGATTEASLLGDVNAAAVLAAGTMPTAEIALGEIVVRASAGLPAPTRANATIQLETRDVRVSGRAVAAVILLTRNGNTRGPARVRWKTVSGTATAAKDYESASSTAQFADGQAVRTIFVPILQRPPEGESRTFSVMLERAPRGPSLGSITSTTVTILGSG